MDELTIRDAQEEDLEQLQALYFHLNPEDASCPPELAKDILTNLRSYRGSTILIGAVESAIVATCTVVIIPNLTRGGKPYALVENVVTHQEWRNKGIGSAMLAEAASRAWENFCYKVMLMTGSKNPNTIAFYTSAGFEQTKTGFQMRRPEVWSAEMAFQVP
jgi:GNAT superfamily N-acetyltransferase